MDGATGMAGVTVDGVAADTATVADTDIAVAMDIAADTLVDIEVELHPVLLAAADTAVESEAEAM